MPLQDDTEAIETRLVLEAIFLRYGYRFQDYAPEAMQRRVRAAFGRSGLSNLGELQHRLLVDPDFFASMLDDLTVRVSEMFRDPPFYRAFRERVVPLLRTYPQLKIWHAGCASGEEVYTTAILLCEENLYDRAQIYATDLSSSALDKARKGVYSEAETVEFARNYAESGGRGHFDDYYSSAYGRIVVREGLRKNIVFFQHDLTLDYALGEMHVVFCRNVLIYFGTALRQHVFDTFARSLGRGGILCLGKSESIPASQAAFFSELDASQRIYRRKASS